MFWIACTCNNNHDACIDLYGTQLSSLDAASYHAWVQMPVPDHPVFFATPWMENITKVKWWVVPLVWVPVAVAWFVWGGSELGGLSALLAALCGALSWQAMEYSLHRWVFHARPSGHWAICAHFLMHGCHHKFPQDIERLVFPPVPAAAIAAVIYSMVCLILPKVQERGTFWDGKDYVSGCGPGEYLEKSPAVETYRMHCRAWQIPSSLEFFWAMFDTM